ncbi:carbohydrate-binding module family 18 protein [Thermothielavioides terrestris NRRL 8126]|uniref:Carbohydrate-binding module family 18 protein n=1 Tax=Thermothielavioides terrestris (strain ATCC 38088 / NRRL 8126) TaxID=578455 RepID=G2R0U5_THETT|nr:carbohydrate-binding module family 18 protein [Thermothielavioides terrestris NRRL 8126]AEO64837.1 carbohydrate-binding module family 18 protein [Thermothielavioides terrestris NRRL 8126]
MRSIYVGLAAALCWTGVLGLDANNHATDERIAELAGLAAGRRLMKFGTRHRNATSNFAELGLRQANDQCGAQYGRCPGDLCCSSYGYCGDSIDYCNPLFDCQPDYGTCGWPRTTAALPPTTTTTSTPVAPPTTQPTTTTTTRPTSLPTTTTTTSSGASPTAGMQTTTNGMCGNNTMCIGNPNFGPCCSQFFWCGSSIEYCGAGCQSAYGACLGVPGQPGNPPTNVTTTPGFPGQTTTTTTPTPPPTTTTSRPTTTTTTTTSSSPTVSIPPGLTSSTDGRCGNGVTCLGSNFGRCCSQFGYCGDGDQYCPYIVGCQPQFGYCDPQTGGG